MSTLATATATVVQLPRRADAPIAAGQLADADLDRWANRLARLLLAGGVGVGSRIALAVDPAIEATVAEAAVRKIGAIPVPVAEGTAPVAGFGITTKERRAELTDTADWLVLDDRSTLRRYLVSSDAPLSGTDLRAVC
ncbi:hypothetical protein BOX37_23020 [Nocardia mangyaensis]|uniref:AMP-dependent synthetase/ligase domain-containing protein n=1 Tax=Nocardia mangyaensis TaxID=2213200 RepID=A0A1J0VWC0_9NOCA|nr:AMP-binding protein [Nocardia mangyaensis]APE36326.1 hypothetical protein BOX37_23020 [Nocardia mangyaensis]